MGNVKESGVPRCTCLSSPTCEFQDTLIKSKALSVCASILYLFIYLFIYLSIYTGTSNLAELV